MVSTVSFFSTGYNAQNWAMTANDLLHTLNRTQQGVGITLPAPLAFGAVFNISAAQYADVKKSDYIRITNDNQTRYGFINNFMQLANGNYAVAYSLDDWANFVLSGEYELEFDGMTERANVPLVKNNNGELYVDNYYASSCTRKEEFDVTNFKQAIKADISNYSEQAIPDGYYVVLYWIGTARYDGAETPALFSGEYKDVDVNDGNATKWRQRSNSSIVAMMYRTSNDNNVKVVRNETLGQITPDSYFSPKRVNSKAVLKSMRFDDFLPWVGYPQILWDGGTPYLVGAPGDDKDNFCDIYESSDGNYYKGVKVEDFAPFMRINVYDWIERETDYSRDRTEIILPYKIIDNVMNVGELYRSTGEFATLKLKYLGAEVEIPLSEITKNLTAYCGVSSDGETAIIKLSGLRYQRSENELSAVGENTSITEKTYETDYRQYRAAKITGTIGMFGSAISGAAGIGGGIASMMTGNVAVGTIGVMQGVQGLAGIAGQYEKLKTLNPSSMQYASEDIIVKESLGFDKLRLEISHSGGRVMYVKLKEMHRFGVATNIEFTDYYELVKNSGLRFAAVKCMYCDIHGLPEQANRRISDSLTAGVTLWGTVDKVGDKNITNWGTF